MVREILSYDTSIIEYQLVKIYNLNLNSRGVCYYIVGMRDVNSIEKRLRLTFAYHNAQIYNFIRY